MTITLRPYQEMIEEETRLKMAAGSKSVLIQMATGAGKCLGKGTSVILFSGEVKKVEDIKIGDYLMGPDSKPRFVQSICSGQEKLYRIRPIKGEAFVANESHILSLKRIKKRAGKDNPAYESRSKKPGSIVNISIKEYLEKTTSWKHIHKLWRVGVDWPEQKIHLRISPYFLGVWLGDGSSAGPIIHSIDPEIVSAVYTEADRFNLSIRKYVGKDKCPAYAISSGKKGGSSQRNEVVNILKSLHLIKNKHIPKEYLFSSPEDRLELLAGIIDTDGSLAKGHYDLIFKSKRLASDICFLARSLGFASYNRMCQKTCVNNGVSGTYWRVSVCGDVSRIPVRVKRKIFAGRKQKKNWLVTGFSLEDLGLGAFYGFEIDGDRLFLLGDFTVTHNTATAASIVSKAQAKGKRVGFTVHRKDLIKQTGVAFDDFNIPYSHVASGLPYNPHSLTHVCSIDTLKNRLDKFGPPDLLIVDECHMANSEGWSRTINYYKQRGAYIIGLSATPWRLDGSGLGEIFDDMVTGPSMRWLIDNNYLSEYRYFAPSSMDMAGIRTIMGDYNRADMAARWEGESIIVGDAIKHYRKHCDGRRAIVYCVSRKHSERVAADFRAAGIPAQHMDGETDMRERAKIISDYADGIIKVICNVDLITTGFDLAAQVGRDVAVEAIILLRPTKSLSLYLQMVGRGLRYKTEPAIILDHSNNAMMHGLPDEERRWTLKGRDKRLSGAKDRTIPVRQCEVCYFCFKPAQICPSCGHVHAVQFREVEETDGELEEVAIERKRQARMEVGAARTIDELKVIAKERGYAPGWVHQMARVKKIYA